MIFLNIYAPDYYNDFKCISNQCKHNCCIGWEIDIDEDTYEKYKNINSEFGKRLRSGISTEDELHFCLSENERCPFLNDNNLCDIIINLGEDHLCQICDDHPRFRNFFSDREEIGLGLCCEAVAELILKRKEKTEFITISGNGELIDSEETSFFDNRNKVYSILQNRDYIVNERIKQLCATYEISLPQWDFSKWSDILRNLERLDIKWDKYLDKLTKLDSINYDKYSSEEWELSREQLLVYMVYRHMAEGFYDESIQERLAFAIVSDMLIIAICQATSEDITEIARSYSSEIEYSDDNLNTIFDILTQNYKE